MKGRIPRQEFLSSCWSIPLCGDCNQGSPSVNSLDVIMVQLNSQEILPKDFYKALEQSPSHFLPPFARACSCILHGLSSETQPSIPPNPTHWEFSGEHQSFPQARGSMEKGWYQQSTKNLRSSSFHRPPEQRTHDILSFLRSSDWAVNPCPCEPTKFTLSALPILGDKPRGFYSKLFPPLKNEVR